MASPGPADESVLNATLIDRKNLSGDLSIVRVRPDSGTVPDFLAGQFIKLGLPREDADATTLEKARPRSTPRLIRRAYSIASSPREKDHVELLVVRVETGKLTPKLWEIEPGGRLWMDEKVAGHFTLDPIPPDKDVVMVATGTGIAPFISMLRTYRDEPRWRRAALINGVRYAADLAYRDMLEEWARDNSRIFYLPLVTREPPESDWTGLRGRVQTVLEPHTYASLTGGVLHPHECHVMLCGNPDMIVSVQKTLEERGFRTHSTSQPGNIHFERYW